MMGCPDENTVCEYIEGTLSAGARDGVEQHLDKCSACRQLVGQMVHVFRGTHVPVPASLPGEAQGLEVVQEAPGRYRPEGERGSGGQGRVLVMYDRFMGRQVAMKVLEPSGPADATSTQKLRRSTEMALRFLREVRLAGQLAHPAVIDVFELGQRSDGTLYYTMPLIRGQTLAETLAAADGLDQRLRLLEHFVDVCNGVAYAHSQGVLHRDLKPTNIMIGEFGETVILDWGLAVRRGEEPSAPTTTDASLRPEMTMAGTFIGTPAYMSPEQARGAVDRIDHRSDIWGLGALLHEVLTGRPPFEGESALEIIEKVTSQDVPPLRSRHPEVPAELAAVAQKALSPAPMARYASARLLGRDVASFLAGARVTAFHYGAWQLVRSFVRRHRLPLAAGLIVFLTTLAALVAVTTSYRGERRALARSRYHLAQAYGDRAARLLGQQRKLEARIYAAAVLVNDPDNPRLGLEARSTLYQARFRVIEGLRRFVRLSGPIRGLAFGPNGRLVTGDRAGQVQLWPAVGDPPLRRAGHDGEVLDIALAPDGELAASAGHDGRVWLWSLARGERIRSLSGHVGRVNSVAFAPGGRLLVSGGKDRTVRLWDVASGRVVRVLRGHLSDVLTVAFAPDGQSVASGGLDATIRLWSVADGKSLHSLPGHRELVTSLAFSADGSWLASASVDHSVRLWAPAEGKLLRTLRRGDEMFFAVAFTPSGLLASGSLNGFLRIWDPRTGAHLGAMRAHTDRIYRVVAAGCRLATAGGDGVVRVWQVSPGPATLALEDHDAAVVALRYAPDGTRIATTDGRLIRLWDAATGRLLRVLTGHEGAVAGLAFAPDSRRLASASIDGTVRLWDPRSGDQLASRTFPGPATSVAYSPDGRQVAAGCIDREVRLLAAGDLAPLARLAGHKSGVWSVAFAPDGRQLAAASYDGTASLWDVAGRRMEHRLYAHDGWVSETTFSHDGRLLATAGRDGLVVVWDRRGRLVRRLRGHSQWVRSARFSPDGTQIFTAADDRSVRAWSTVDGTPLMDIKTRTVVATLDVAPDGRMLAYADGRRVRLLPLAGELHPGASPAALLARAEAAAGLRLTGFDLKPLAAVR